MTFSTRENVALFSQIQIFFQRVGLWKDNNQSVYTLGLAKPKVDTLWCAGTVNFLSKNCCTCTRSVLTRPICTTIYSKLFGASKSKFTSKDLSGNFVDSSRAALSVQTYTRELRNYFGFLHRITSLGSSQQLRASLTRSSCTRMC